MILRIITIIIVISLSNNLFVNSKYIANNAMRKRSVKDERIVENVSDDFNNGNN